MGVYETLFRFADVTGRYMGDQGTHPWAQGFPLTTPVPGGPELPSTIEITATDRMYPKAEGQPLLREAIADYYNEFYGAGITADHVAVFAGGRPGIFATLAFLLDGVTVAVEETEYTPYWDMLQLLGREPTLIASNEANRFRPGLVDHPVDADVFLLKSNPCNPTGVATTGDDLQALVDHYGRPGRERCSTRPTSSIATQSPRARFAISMTSTRPTFSWSAPRPRACRCQACGWAGSWRHVNTSRSSATIRRSEWAASRAPLSST